MSYTLSDFWKSRIQLQRQPSPIVVFYELELPDSSYFRIVDFMDASVNLSAPNTITFNGVEFTTRRVHRSTINDDTQSIRPQVALSIADPDHSVAFYIRTYNGLRGQPVKVWITTYDNLATEADALSDTFSVISAVIVQDPPSATLVLGMKNLAELMFPKVFYDRRRCFSSYQDRHIVGNLCRYPSNEFGPSTEQNYLTGGQSTEQERLYGWFTQKANRAYEYVSNDNGRLKIEVRNALASWWEGLRNGPYLYRYLDGDFDVYTSISQLISTRDLWTLGLLIQDSTEASPDPEEEDPPTSPTSSWLYWAMADDGASSNELLKRETDDDVSVDATYAYTDSQLRISRVGSTITLYSRATEGSSWTQRATSSLVLPSTVRVGVAVSSVEQTTDAFGGYFDYLRFTVGGLETCARTRSDCYLHRNLHAFNGYDEIPNDRARA